MPRLIDADMLRHELIMGHDLVGAKYTDMAETVKAIPVDYIWDRAEFYEKQWLEDDNHWCKNVAEALRALLEDWDGEQGGGIFDKYENS